MQGCGEFTGGAVDRSGSWCSALLTRKMRGRLPSASVGDGQPAVTLKTSGRPERDVRVECKVHNVSSCRWTAPIDGQRCSLRFRGCCGSEVEHEILCGRRRSHADCLHYGCRWQSFGAAARGGEAGLAHACHGVRLPRTHICHRSNEKTGSQSLASRLRPALSACMANFRCTHHSEPAITAEPLRALLHAQIRAWRDRLPTGRKQADNGKSTLPSGDDR
jgi:hypothetical protein